MNSLAELPGVGPRLAERLEAHFGSQTAARAALVQGDLEALAAVEGLGVQRALRLARAATGGESDFLATPEAEAIHQQLLEQLATHAGCGATRHRVRLLTPLPGSQRTAIEQRQARFAAALDLAAAHPAALAPLREACQGLALPRPPRLRAPRVVVCVSAASYRRLRPLKKLCRLLQRGDGETARDYQGLAPLTWVGAGGPDRPPADWLVLPAEAGPAEALPELTVAWFRHNRPALAALARLAELELPSHTLADWLRQGLEGLAELPGALASLDHDDPELTQMRAAHDNLWKVLGDIEVWVNEEIERRVRERSVTLGGEKILRFLREPRGLRAHLDDEVGSLLDEVTAEGETRFHEFLAPTGLSPPRELFGPEFPRAVDQRTIRRLEEKLETRLREAEDTALRDLAERLRPLQPRCEAALRHALELELRLTVAAWARARSLRLPEFAAGGVAVTEGHHLLLEDDVDVEPVSYGLGTAAATGDRQRVALLSGANSGGKTTLLELLAQVVILAHCGLPVPAAGASVGLTERLFFMAKARGAQSAGALERTLLSLAAIVTSPAPKLVLADELEAITEPGAGARILAALLEAAQANPATVMLLVTHLAPQISDACGAELRVDGIEARGLDEHLELLVDRTPRRDHLARSTPELIVRRLVERAEGAERALFEQVLAKFGEQ